MIYRMGVGEPWSARKVLRRAPWRERDHTQHTKCRGVCAIAKLIRE